MALFEVIWGPWFGQETKPAEPLKRPGDIAMDLQSFPKANVVLEFSGWLAHFTAGQVHGGGSADFPLLEVVVGFGFLSVAIIGFFLSPLILGS